MVDLLAVGEVLLDVLAPPLEPGRAVHAPIGLRVGGTAANAALAAVAEGASAAVVARVGDDAAGALARETLRAAGVEPLLAVDPELPTGAFLAAGDALAADRGASARLSPADLPETLRAGVVLVSDYAPAAVAAAAAARADAAWIAAGDGNARFVHGEPGDLDALAARYRLVCVTLGPEGAVAALDGVVERRRPAERLPEPQPGAGDALAAVVLLALLRGLPLGEALERGVARACAPRPRTGRRPAASQ